MAESDRRVFLKQTTAGVAGLAAVAAVDPTMVSARQKTSTSTSPGIPPHKTIALVGLHAYAEKSIAAGQPVHFRTSSTVPYKLSVCRLAGGVDEAAHDVVLRSFGELPARPQPIHPGSYVHVEKGLPIDKPLTAISLECWIRPWRPRAWQGIITQHDHADACGIGLFMDADGRALFYLGDGTKFDASRSLKGPLLEPRRWYHLVGTWDGETATLWVDGRRAERSRMTKEVRPARAPLRLGAYGRNGEASYFLDGDLAMPAIYDRELSEGEIGERFDAEGLVAPPLENLVACWPLTEEEGDRVADASLHKRHGRIINHATWMIGGPSFHGDTVGRYDSTYDPTQDEKRGHGLRLASDDLFDCRWRVTSEYTIPKDAKSGVYVGRCDYELDGNPYQYQVTFIVRRANDRPKAPILVLCSSSTWLAYNAAAFPIAVRGLHYVGTNGLKSCNPTAPAYSCYRNHHAGQPTYYLGLNMPWPSASADVLYSAHQVGYSHLMRAELFLHRWLDGAYGDHAGYDYDVVTDLDLHRDPALLDGYKTLIINGHSEYWSAEAYQAVDQYLKSGGTTVVLSGNTMFWRTSFSNDAAVMECRKFQPDIGGRQGDTPGEIYHSHDRRRGSLMRHCDLPAWKVVGLECLGWWGISGAEFGVYELVEPDHFLLNRPEKIGLKKGETFGHGPGGKLPRAVGHEGDVRLTRLRPITREVPEGAELASEPRGITTLAHGVRRPATGKIFGYYTRTVAPVDDTCAELIYWERPEGGRVVNAGAIGAGWPLSADPKLRTLLRNVLYHFDVTPRTA